MMQRGTWSPSQVVKTSADVERLQRGTDCILRLLTEINVDNGHQEYTHHLEHNCMHTYLYMYILIVFIVHIS